MSFLNKKHLTSFENILIKKKTKRYEPGQRYFTSGKTSVHHLGSVMYATVTLQRAIIQQNMLHNGKKLKKHIFFLKTQ